MRLLLGFIISSLILFSACFNEQPDTPKSTLSAAVEKQVEKVMAIHDEVMPEMETIQALTEKLEGAQKAAKGDKKEIAAALAALASSDDAMMGWMRQYQMPMASDGKSEAEKMAYLADQKTKIEQVAKEMRNSIEYAERLLEE